MLGPKNARCLDTFVENFRIAAAEGGEAARLQTVAYFLHETVVEVQIVHDAKAHSEHLFCLKKMPYIGSRIVSARRAFAPLFYRSVIQLILGIEKSDGTVIRVKMTVPSVS